MSRLLSRLAAAASVAALLFVAPRVSLAQSGEVFGPDELSTPPRLVSAAATARLVARTYPEQLRRSGKGGTVRLSFIIGANGKAEPGSIEVVDTPAPELGTAAKSVAENIEFTPGKKGGQPVRARVELPITYQP